MESREKLLDTFQRAIESPYCKYSKTRVCQGDILRDFPIIEWEFTDSSYKKYNIIKNTLPYIVVMTQDCDLEQDYKNRNEEVCEKHDKHMQSILVCPAYPAEKFRIGEHLEHTGRVMEKWNSERFKKIKDQKNERFHFLGANSKMQVPELVIDFKHYYTMPRNAIYMMVGEHYLVTIRELFRESLSQRFSYFLSRIGLPDIKER